MVGEAGGERMIDNVGEHEYLLHVGPSNWELHAAKLLGRSQLLRTTGVLTYFTVDGLLLVSRSM